MEFIRDDGRVYEQTYEDSIERLQKSNRFEQLDDVTVKDLKEYAKKREITGYSNMTRDDLIETLREGD